VTSRALVNATLGSAAIAASLVLGGCDAEMLSTAGAKATKPIPEKLVAEMDKKNIDPQAPMLVRLFKQEAELEVWKQDREGHYALVKTYPICRWSGDLGPKTREGDRQAPEGFYTISPGQMNPQSAYYLSFNIGYPNAYDRSLGRTGSQLMVHGDCSSRGCYAMTDEQIGEIYALGREAFFGGQRAFQVQAYPFRMTPVNLAKHRNNPNMPFWKMIKEGYDHFEVTHLEPKVDVCDHHYVFDAQPPAGSNKPLAFNPSAACPAYQVPDDIAQAVREKEHEDDVKYAELVNRGVPTARLNTGIDGGMNAVFASKLNAQTGLSDPGEFSLANFMQLSSPPAAPGTIPQYVNPPHPPETQQAAATPPAAAPQPAPKVATADRGGISGGFFSSLSKKPAPSETTTASTTASTGAAPSGGSAKPPAHPAPVTASLAPRPPFAAAAKPAGSQPAAAPTQAAQGQTQGQTATKPATQAYAADQTITGAAPAMPANSFDSRWSSLR